MYTVINTEFVKLKKTVQHGPDSTKHIEWYDNE